MLWELLASSSLYRARRIDHPIIESICDWQGLLLLLGVPRRLHLQVVEVRRLKVLFKVFNLSVQHDP